MKRKTVFILALVCIGLLPVGCRKESAIAKELEVGKLGGTSAYRVLSLLHIGEEIAFRRTDAFLTALTVVEKTDSLYKDGDGLAFTIDFGVGVVCADGIMRKGSCTLELIDTAFPVLYFQLKASASDSFAISAKTGWEFIVGQITLNNLSTIKADLDFDLEFFRENNSIMKIATTVGNSIKVSYMQPMDFTKNGETWTGAWELVAGDKKAQLDALKIQNNGECFSNWNKGELLCAPSKDNYNSFENQSITFDPFGNEACDQVFKVSALHGLINDEMTFDAW